MGLITYNGESKIIKKLAELLNVTDVKANGTSIVDSSGVANFTDYVPKSTGGTFEGDVRVQNKGIVTDTVLTIGGSNPNLPRGTTGRVALHDASGVTMSIKACQTPYDLTSNQTVYFRDKSGAIALLSDVDECTKNEDIYTKLISRIPNTNYTMYEMALYVHNYILKDNQSISAEVEYSTSGADFFMVGYRRTDARGRYLIAKRTDDDWYSCRITAIKTMNYSKLTREAASSVTIA